MSRARILRSVLGNGQHMRAQTRSDRQPGPPPPRGMQPEWRQDADKRRRDERQRDGAGGGSKYARKRRRRAVAP